MAFIRLPQGLAYGALANVPPINGLYTELWSCLLYSLFGTSRHASVGTFAVLSLMTGSLVDQYVDPSMCENGTIPVSGPENLTIPQYDENCLNRAKTTFVVSATMLCGIIQMVMGILQFGRLSILLPRHVVQAFTTGIELKFNFGSVSSGWLLADPKILRPFNFQTLKFSDPGIFKP